MPTFETRFAEIYRNESGRCRATLIRLTGDIDAAEDALGEALAVAAERWPGEGIPANPGGWLTTTARNKAIDRRRREATRHDRHVAAHALAADETDDPPDLGPADALPDDQLRLIFLSCHPELSADAQVALTLRLVCGLTTADIARAFVIPEPTMAQRLVRAKRHIRDRRLDYRIPTEAELPERLDAVLASLYLMLNEAHTAASGPELGRVDLAAEAIRVMRLLRELLPEEAEVAGLLSLALLTEARRPARTDDQGEPIRLADQERSLWSSPLREEGLALIRECVRRNEPGPYQLQAAIAAVHAHAADSATTDWPQIVTLYDHLLQFLPNPMVQLNRAVALAQVDGPMAGLAAIEELPLQTVHLFHATRAEFLLALDRVAEARAAYDAAIQRCSNDAERRMLERRRDALASRATRTPGRASR